MPTCHGKHTYNRRYLKVQQGSHYLLQHDCLLLQPLLCLCMHLCKTCSIALGSAQLLGELADLVLLVMCSLLALGKIGLQNACCLHAAVLTNYTDY